jgi:nucleotidyltransferase/DNA polymerase involved in DNA repair
MDRAIFHVDMDAFYASVEQRDNPEYREKPVIVGSDPRGGNGRGVVAACSYQARSFGIHSAMPIGRAFRHCSEGIYLRPDMKKYAQVSRKIRGILTSFTEMIEPLSIDEAFLDMSPRVRTPERALTIGRSIKAKIFEAEHLSCSIGIAPNKFADPLPITRLWGVGPKTEARLSGLGIKTILQLRRHDQAVLEDKLGKLGAHLWRLANGIDDRPVKPRGAPKSLGHETTFQTDESDEVILERALRGLSQKVARRLGERGLYGKTVTLKIRYSDFTTITRQASLGHHLFGQEEINAEAQRLLKKFRDPSQKIRLIGVSMSGLEGTQREPRQLRLF